MAVTCRPEDLAGPRWDEAPLTRVPLVPYRDVPALYAAADVVAIPQLDTEAAQHQMPLKAPDAMAMARPIVASAVSDLPDVLDGCARLVPPGDVDALAAAIAESPRAIRTRQANSGVVPARAVSRTTASSMSVGS